MFWNLGVRPAKYSYILLLIIIWFCKMGNSQTAAHWSHGPEASQWPGMSLSQTLMQNHTLETLPQRQVQRRTRQPQQNRQVWWTGQHAHLLPSFHRNRRYLESLGCWACPVNWQTGHINHWRTQRIHLFVSAVVNSPPKGKCGHLWLRLDTVAVIPCLVQF